MLRYLFSIAGALLFATAVCGETVTHVRTVSTTNFLGWGQTGFYFPQFDASSVVGPKRTDDNMQFFVPNWLEFNFDPWDLEKTTFSADKPDCFDNCSGRGVYTRGGYSHWDAFALPNGFSGLSGSVVDEQAENNSNNTVNRITMKNGVPSSFCMHIVTDNTANAHDSAGTITARVGRPGQGSFDPNAAVPNLAFDGTTDVHTFRFDDFLPGDFIKIRLNSGVPGVEPGFGGLMFDQACDYIPNQQCGNNVCDINLGESCESCPGDCGACIPGPTPTRDWVHHGSDPQSHSVAGANRLLIFAAHGVDASSHWVQGVKYGNKDMHFLEARSQDRNDKSTVSVWYLKEADIYSAGGSNFSVDWFHKPSQRSYESIFFTDVSQAFSFGAVGETGCNDCFSVTCPSATIEPSHLSVYAGTHERDGASFTPLNGYTQDGDFWMGGNGRATLGHKNGIGNVEWAGAQFGREGAFSLVCFEVQDIPQTLPQPDSDGDGLSDALESVIGTLPDDEDTDNDGVSDYDEVNFDGDASVYNPATDLNPFDDDTDGDGAGDAIELFVGTDPLDDGDVPLPDDGDAPQGKIGIIGDSIAAGTHSSEMCGNQNIVDCIQDLGGQHSRDWSYAGGEKSWSIASTLGYLPNRIVDVSDDGEEWKDAFDQAMQVMADPQVETVFIGLGANDVCQARGHDYSGDLEVVASLIDETLNYLTSNLPAGGSIYWSGVPDVVQMRELMRNRDHNLLFKTCQATWDLDNNEVKDGVAEDACDHYFDNSFCEDAGGQGQALDLLMELILDTWLDLEGIEEGPCGKILNSASTDQDRLEARNFTAALNQLMAQKARDWTGQNGIDVHYNDRLYYASATVEPHHLSRFDCYHPSRSGQMKFAYEIWSGFNHGDEQVKGVFIDEFDSTDYCTQEFGDWGSCWVETNDDNAATSGDIQIAGNVVSMRRESKQISRAMDLQHVDRAWLSFNRRRDNLDNLGDFIDVQISPDAGQTWHQLDHFEGEATDFGIHRGSYYDISQYATADTRIGLISSSQMGENDWLFFDNVKVNAWDSSAASQAAPVYGELLLDENWLSVGTPVADAPAVTFMGVTTDSTGGAGVAPVRIVGTDQFEVQLQELAEAGGEVSAEQVPYLVLQTGTYVMPDGSHWEVGSFDIAADGTWQSKVFKTPFADRPFLFLSLQTANNAVFPLLQVRTVDAAGFEVALFEQVASSSPGSNETAAYLAIYSPANAGTIHIADTDQPYRLQRVPLDGYWTSALDTFLRLRDGINEDERINAETHDVLALGTHVFAQQVSKTGSDLAAPQQIEDGLRGATATPLAVSVTQVNPESWPIGSASPVIIQLSMPTGFSFRDINATTFLIQGEALAVGFDAQSGQLSIPFADLETKGLLSVGENHLSVSGELFDETPFQATFTVTVSTEAVVPDVVGMSYSEAVDSIRLAGMAVGDVEEEETAAVPVGQVLRQSLAPASQVPSSTVVNLVIASAVTVLDGSSADSTSGGGGGGCSYSPGHAMDPVLPLVAWLSLVFLGLWRRQGPVAQRQTSQGHLHPRNGCH